MVIAWIIKVLRWHLLSQNYIATKIFMEGGHFIKLLMANIRVCPKSRYLTH